MVTTVVGVYKYFEGAAVVLQLIRNIVVLVPVHMLGLLNFLPLILSRVTLTPPSIR